MKTCTGCGQAKPLDQFVKDKRSKDGRQAHCKACTNAAYRTNYKRELETNRTKKRAYRTANADRTRALARERVRRWRERNPELARERTRASIHKLLAANPSYFREYYRKNIEREREAAKRRMAKSRLTKPERERARKQRYRLANADLVREREREKTYARRAMMTSSSETARYMTRLLREPCAYCGARENITIDHVVPLSRGGEHEPANLAPACLSCNSSKCALLLEEWEGPPRLRAA